MNHSNPSSAADKPTQPGRRRWLQFSLRSLFVLTAICAVAAWRGAVWYRAMEAEERVIDALTKRGFTVKVEETSECPPAWFRWLVGKSDFKNVVRVAVSYQLALGAVQKPDLLTRDEFALLSELPALKELWFMGVAINDDGYAALARIGSVRALELNFFIDPDLAPHAFDEIAKMTQLEDLTLWGGEVTDDNLAKLVTLKNLTRLTLHFPGITDEAFASIKEMTQLKSLYLNRTTVTGSGFRYLVNSRIEEIRLDSANVDPGIKKYLDQMPQLKSFDSPPPETP